MDGSGIFKLADMKAIMQSIDEWLRRRDSDDNMEKMEEGQDEIRKSSEVRSS